MIVTAVLVNEEQAQQNKLLTSNVTNKCIKATLTIPLPIYVALELETQK